MLPDKIKIFKLKHQSGQKQHHKKSPRQTFQGFTPMDLLETFDQIRDRTDWKNPVRYTFSSDTVKHSSFPALIAKCDATIAFYHNNKATWQSNPDGSITLISRGLHEKS